MCFQQEINKVESFYNCNLSTGFEVLTSANRVPGGARIKIVFDEIAPPVFLVDSNGVQICENFQDVKDFIDSADSRRKGFSLQDMKNAYLF